jgi:peptidyl-prolyl cis-trans isomerase SurA
MTKALFTKTVAICFALAIGLIGAQAQAQSARITVNGVSITDQQINSRAGLMRLEGRGASNSARTTMATDELIEEALKLAEAERLGVSVSESQVASAISTVAQNMRLSVSNLDSILQDNGVNPSTLRDRMRASIAWQGVVQQAVTPRIQFSEIELDMRAAEQVQETTSFDYILKEVLFVIPRNGGTNAQRRTAEANQYRTRFTGCDTAVQNVLSFQDAAVRDIGRRHATQLPEAVATELASLSVGQISRPRVVENGVSMYAICEKASARDLTFIKQDIRQEVGNEQLQAEAATYLERLKTTAAITRR